MIDWGTTTLDDLLASPDEYLLEWRKLKKSDVFFLQMSFDSMNCVIDRLDDFYRINQRFSPKKRERKAMPWASSIANSLYD